MSKRTYLCGGSLVALVLVAGVPAPVAAQPARPAAEVSEVVVTGSFIRGTPQDAALPVQVIGADELEKQGAPSTVELIKALSVSSGVLGETNQFDTRAQGSEGSGSINLRGLGAQRTLVLINGRRMSYNPFGQAGAGIVDTNTLPTAAFGRIEVLKEGAAATYGSDAIGGVVNFITRKNLNGFEVAGSFRRIDGSDGDWDASANWGHVWDNGNVLVSFGHQHRALLPTTARDWALQSFNNDPEGGWSGGNAVTAFLPIARTPTGFTPVAGFQVDQGCAPLGGVVIGGALPACNLHYTAWDNIVEQEDRYQAYAEANADLGEHHHLHVEGLYAKTDVPHWQTSPSYLALQTPTATTSPEVGVLPAAYLAGYYVPADNPGFIAYRAAHPDQIPASATAVHIPGLRYRPLSYGGNPLFGNDVGASEGLRHYEAFRVSAGLNGDLPWEGVGYDVAVTFGQESGRRTGYDTVVSRLQLALRGFGSLASGAGGGCTAEKTNGFTTGAGNSSIGCYYFNPFSTATAANVVTGQANPGYVASTANNPDLIRWLFPQVATKQVANLFVWDAVLNGKTGFSLPGGEVAWAGGVQYRRDGFESRYDDLSNIKVTPCIDTPVTGSTACAIRNGALAFLGTGEEQELHNDVWAAFAEFRLPVTDRIEAQLAIRHEKYGRNVGSTTNPKLSAKWQLTDWFALRATVGTTFRGPPLTSLTNSSVTGLSFIGGSFRAIDFFGNPALQPEKAKQYSFGGLFKVGGLRAAIDYWRFDFQNPIVAEPSGAMVATMFPATGPNGCGTPLQARFTFQGACSIALIARVRTQVVNGPAVETSGVDFLADYSMGKTFGGDLTIGANATYTLDYKVDPFRVEGVVVQPAFDAVGFLNYQLSATSLPQLKGQAYLDWSMGPHNLRITETYIDSYKDQRTSILAPNAVTGQVLTNGEKIDATWLTNVTYRAQLPWDTTLTVSVDNLFDRDPSFARLDLNYDPFTGMPLGRTYKVSMRKRF